ncbi:MAG: ABC transporter ATP-binding protein, partial [Christensenellales bacterium]
VAMALFSLCFGVLSGRFAAVASTGFGKNVREKQFNKIQEFSFLNMDKFTTASLITRLTTDVTNVQSTFMMLIRVFFRAPVMLILAICMSISIDAELSLIFLGAIPVLIITLVLLGSIGFPRFFKMLKKYDELNITTQENITGIRVVKSFVRENYETEKFKKVSSSCQLLQYKAEKIIVIAMPIMQAVMYACMVLVTYFGGNKIIRGGMYYGDLTAFISYITQILMSLMMIGFIFIMVVMSRASAGRIVEILDEKIDITDENADPELTVKDGTVEFENVEFSYSKNPENLNLKKTNIKIESGEVIGVIGGTGSSKSTFVQLIPRLYDVTSGSVKVGGRDVRDYKLKTLRDSVAMVLQKNVLFSGTIKDNLKWGNHDATDEEIIHATKAAQAHDFIESFPNGYETMLGQGGVNVSGGQKQRLCIARALLKKPKIMILDDSTSAVDTATDKKIREALKENFNDITVFIIAQRVTSVADADRIIVLNDGEISGVGTHEELLKSNEIYKEVYELQKQGVE